MNKLRTYRQNKGLTQADLAQMVGASQSQIVMLETGKRKLTKEWAERLAPCLGVTADMLLFPPKVTPVRGYVAAGAAVQFVDELPEGYDEVPAPPGSGPNTSALEVRGASMPGVAEDRWHIYYDERVYGVPDALIGELCVVWLIDGGGCYIKKIYRGRYPGTFDLVSTGHEPIRDVEVESSAKVTWIKPR